VEDWQDNKAIAVESVRKYRFFMVKNFEIKQVKRKKP
jgi:hypothetical protein